MGSKGVIYTTDGTRLNRSEQAAQPLSSARQEPFELRVRVKRALISDIHANLEALTAVLADIERQQVQEVICLGDIIGYGPDPIECLNMVMQRCSTIILGNHDLLEMSDNLPAAAVYFIRSALRQLEGGEQFADVERHRAFLNNLPRHHTEGDFLFVHGSPREPTHEYVYPEDIADSVKMDALFEHVTKYCFQGHTHVPGIFTPLYEFFSPADCDHHFRLTGHKLMVNVGSVGQPRDDDPRACYVILEDGAVIFRRVPYAVDEMMRKLSLL